jgi:hypothetical protein
MNLDPWKKKVEAMIGRALLMSDKKRRKQALPFLSISEAWASGPGVLVGFIPVINRRFTNNYSQTNPTPDDG